jgi:hypothetical protein
VLFETVDGVVASSGIEIVPKLSFKIFVAVQVTLSLLVRKSIVETWEFVAVRVKLIEETFGLVMTLCGSDVSWSVSLRNCVVPVEVALGLLCSQLLKTFAGVTSVFFFAVLDPMASSCSIVLRSVRF